MKIPACTLRALVEALPDTVRVRLLTLDKQILNRVHATPTGRPPLTIVTAPYPFLEDGLEVTLIANARLLLGPLLAIRRRPLTAVLGIADTLSPTSVYMGVADEDAS